MKRRQSGKRHKKGNNRLHQDEKMKSSSKNSHDNNEINSFPSSNHQCFEESSTTISDPSLNIDRVRFSPEVKFKPPRKPRNKWLESLSAEEQRTLSRNQKLVDRYKQTVLKRYGLPENASNKLISRSCIPRKVLILISKASKDVSVLFRRSQIYIELEDTISSDILERNSELADKQIQKFISKYGSVDNIPDGNCLKAYRDIEAWKNIDEFIIQDKDIIDLESLS